MLSYAQFCDALTNGSALPHEVTMSHAIIAGKLRAHPHLQQLVQHSTQMASDIEMGKVRLTSNLGPEVLNSIKLEIGKHEQACNEGCRLL